MMDKPELDAVEDEAGAEERFDTAIRAAVGAPEPDANAPKRTLCLGSVEEFYNSGMSLAEWSAMKEAAARPEDWEPFSHRQLVGSLDT
jgi:hypothetical protein